MAAVVDVIDMTSCTSTMEECCLQYLYCGGVLPLLWRSFVKPLLSHHCLQYKYQCGGQCTVGRVNIQSLVGQTKLGEHTKHVLQNSFVDWTYCEWTVKR